MKLDASMPTSPHDRQRACRRGTARVGPAEDTCDDSTQSPARQGVSSQAADVAREVSSAGGAELDGDADGLCLGPCGGSGRELPDGHRGATGGQRVESARGTGGQRGGARRQRGQCPPSGSGPATVSPRLPFSTIAAVSPGPKEAELSAASFSRSGGDRAQWLPPSEDQAASRAAAGPVPAASSATVPLAVLVSLSTCTGWLARAAGSGGSCCVPGAARAGEDACGSRVAAGPGEHGCPRRGERGGGEVLQPAAAAGGRRREGPLGGQGGPAGVAGSSQVGGAVGEQGEQVARWRMWRPGRRGRRRGPRRAGRPMPRPGRRCG